MAAPEISLAVGLVEEAGDWSKIETRAIVDRLVAALSARVPEARGTATVALADDRMIHDLNARFRNVDRPTNVLSFPSGEASGAEAYLGDVALASETLRREAAAEGKPVDHHFAHLALHGLLHLLGYDHESDADAALMERLETEILADIGVPDPYRALAAAMNDR